MSNLSDNSGEAAAPEAPHVGDVPDVPQRRRRAIALALTPFALFLLGIGGAVAWYSYDASAPLPAYGAGSGVQFATNGPIPGYPVGNTDIVLWLNDVGDGKARIELNHYESGTEQAWTVAEGDTVNMRGVSLTVCAIWENKHRLAPWDNPAPGDTSRSDRIYYVSSTEDTLPRCPAPIS